ncbi:MAG: four helix bundle protein [Gemmatimonadaceae bacterium]|nr:four helix bundle protein [Actinomycetota bacterium]
MIDPKTEPREPRLDYENLDVYQRAIEFLRLAIRVTGALPRGESELRSQLKRAAMSIPLNIAEACGKPSGADRARYHAIARGSAMECGALIDVCTIAGYITLADSRHGKELIVRVVAMLSRMCR